MIRRRSHPAGVSFLCFFVSSCAAGRCESDYSGAPCARLWRHGCLRSAIADVADEFRGKREPEDGSVSRHEGLLWRPGLGTPLGAGRVADRGRVAYGL